MRNKSYSMQKLLDNFFNLKDKGYTIPQMADMYNLSFSAIYRSLDELAIKMGVTREDLLTRVHKNHSSRKSYIVSIGKDKLDVEKLVQNVDEILYQVGIMNTTISETLKKNKGETTNEI